MTANPEPQALLSLLPSADGSASFSFSGYDIFGVVNGPIEVQRRDELAEEAVCEVNIRPAAGSGGTRERQLESMLQATLRQIILINAFPRTLIQITLQVTSAPVNDYSNMKVLQASSSLPMLPALIHASILALISAAIPLTATLTAAVLAVVTEEGAERITVDPSARDIEDSQSLHVFAFTSHGDLILAESEGEFTMDQWDGIFKIAQRQCCQQKKSDDVDMDTDNDLGADLGNFTRSIVESKIASDLCWKS